MIGTRLRWLGLAFVLSAAAVGCGDDGGEPVADASVDDGGESDDGATGDGGSDAGMADAGPADAGPSDSGEADECLPLGSACGPRSGSDLPCCTAFGCQPPDADLGTCEGL